MRYTSVFDDDADMVPKGVTREEAFDHLTAMLTYPLTLARALSETPRPLPPRREDPLVVDILGARAEAMFPDWIWTLQANIIRVDSLGRGDRPVWFRLIGPSVVNLGERGNDRKFGGVRVTHYPGMLYHDLVRTGSSGGETSKKGWSLPDVFVAFHPGWGAEQWKPYWHPTLKMVLGCCQADAIPLVFTSFDNVDVADDTAFVREVLGEMSAVPSERLDSAGNPFRSNALFEHPDRSRTCHSNSYVSRYETP